MPAPEVWAKHARRSLEASRRRRTLPARQPYSRGEWALAVVGVAALLFAAMGTIWAIVAVLT